MISETSMNIFRANTMFYCQPHNMYLCQIILTRLVMLIYISCDIIIRIMSNQTHMKYVSAAQHNL